MSAPNPPSVRQGPHGVLGVLTDGLPHTAIDLVITLACVTAAVLAFADSNVMAGVIALAALYLNFEAVAWRCHAGCAAAPDRRES